ncbi:glycosyltransferase [Thermococcus zilligii]|uniref:glycosyltransferase n=1 Tax=Thermococcus zilligii TaxID=54076 RepID=UPI000299E08B|nr:glycosyltransferase family 2 protein [Thermococcus zilligii]
MRRKIASYLSALIISMYLVYLDYTMLQYVAWETSRRLFPGIEHYPVYSFVRYLFYLTGAFVITAYATYFIFYIYFRSSEGATKYPRLYPKVSIVVPAYNEGMNIERLLESIYYQDYPFNLVEVIVVDDGSLDATAEIASSWGAKVISHETNLGKARSLEDGIKAATGDVIVTMDADSYFGTGSSLRYIVESLHTKPNIGVSTGVIRIAPIKGSLLEKFQEIEFLHSFEVGRRVQSYLGWLLVVPGAFSAFKSYFLKRLQTVPKDTLAEDFDLGMIAYRAGLDSVFEPNAIIYTYPETSWRRAYRQRLRWYYGGLQVMAKHRDMILNWKYGEKGFFLFAHIILLEYLLSFIHVFGMVSFPTMVLLQYVFDIRVLDFTLPPTVMAFLFFLVFILQYLPGVLMSSIAMAIEHGLAKAFSYLTPILLYYTLYNPLLSIIKVDATLRYMRGVVQGW